MNHFVNAFDAMASVGWGLSQMRCNLKQLHAVDLEPFNDPSEVLYQYFD